MHKIKKRVMNSLVTLLVMLSFAAPAGASFTQNLTIGSTGSEVVALQQMLVAQGHLVMPAGVAYGYFGSLTKAAVAKWQLANGVAPAAGYWGPRSRTRATSASINLPVATIPPVVVQTPEVKIPVLDPIVNIPSVPPVARTLFDSYYLHEPVTFSLQNSSGNSLNLKNGAPWFIKNSSGNIIFTPVATQAEISVPAWGNKTWSWAQTDNLGAQVIPGEYKVVFSDLNTSAKVVITDKIGSSGYFTFYVGPRPGAGGYEPDRIFRAYFTNPQTIRIATERYYKINEVAFPYGKVVDDRPGKSPYDRNWSWHLDPAETEMVEIATEFCDGWPRFLENNLDYWLERVKVSCPAMAYVIKLE